MKKSLIIFVFMVIFAENSFAAKLLFDYNDRLVGVYNTNEECVRARKADIDINYGGNNNIKYKVLWQEHNEWWEIGTETLNTDNASVNDTTENNNSSNVIYAGSNGNTNNMLTTEQIIMQSERPVVVFSGNNDTPERKIGEFMTKEEAIKKREMNKAHVRSNSTSSAIIYNTKDRKEIINY